MGKKSKAPKAPNYAALQTQDAANQRSTAELLTKWNRPTQVDAFGNSITWEQDPSGNWTQRTNLSPQFQQAQQTAMTGYNNAMASLGNQGEFNAPASIGRFSNTAGAIGDFSNTAGGIANFDPTKFDANFDPTAGDKLATDTYESVMNRARGEQSRESEALDVKLRQQGLQPGTEAYNRAMQNLMTSHGDVATQAGFNATAAGYNEARQRYAQQLQAQQQRYGQEQGTYATNLAGQAQRFGQSQDVFNTNLGAQNQRYNQLQGTFNTNLGAQNQDYAQALKSYQMPFDRAAAMANLYQAAPQAQFPGFSGATGYNPADMTGAAQAQYNARMGQYSAGQAKKGSTMGTIGTLGAGAMMMSDENLKKDIQVLSGEESLRKILALDGYSFSWRKDGTPDRGLMAQQVQKVLPNLVGELNGFLAVNYTGVVALLVSAVNYLAGGEDAELL